jgi:hypothetical protein
MSWSTFSDKKNDCLVSGGLMFGEEFIGQIHGTKAVLCGNTFCPLLVSTWY